MRRALEQRIARSLAELIPEYPAVALCVGFSGGLDSTVLLSVLTLLRDAAGRGAPGMRLRAIHVDHGLLPHSHRWAARCRAVARQLRVPLTVARVRVARAAGESLEAAAREARYGAFVRHLDESEVLLTAQHADDQLETVLMQLLRGAGLPGLSGMPARAALGAGHMVRPLLGLERSELERWARGRRLEWIEDDSNADERLDRNYLRRRVIPLLRARWPGAAAAAGRSARHAAEAQGLLDVLARADVESAAEGAGLRVKRLRALSPERRRNALRYWIAHTSHRLPDSRRLAELAGPLIHARSDANPEVRWGDIVAQRQADVLTLRRAARQVALGALVWQLRSQPILELPAALGSLELARAARGPIDIEALPPAITVRLRRGGERLTPRRGGPSRALKDLLREARVPSAERKRMPLMFDGEHLLAAGDVCVDARIRASFDAKQRARLIWHR